MAATLKLCLMVHVEDTEQWHSDKATTLGSLALEVWKSGRNARLSVQFGRQFLDSNATPPYNYPTGVTNLRTILARNGNFWTHTHTSDFDALRSTYSCVRSAHFKENDDSGFEISLIGGPGGRSGGWGFNSAEWVTNTFSAGMRLMNSSVMGAHAVVPTSARPYGITDAEIQALYPKGPAPGPIYSDVMTMRQRPFWMDVASNWFARTDTTYPSASYTGSVMMIPAPGKLDLPGLAEGRTAFNTEQLNDADFKCAMTQAWTAYQNMASHQNSITNVWYTHLPFRNISDSTSAMMGTFVDSMNAMLGANAEWKNMNEIGTLFADPNTFNS